MRKILVCGFNPAAQKVLYFNKLTPGSVNRADRLEQFPSGKGINFCRALNCSGLAQGKLLQFSGGNNGKIIEQGLEKENIPFLSIRTRGATRCCCTCVDRAAGTVTELIEPSETAAPEETNAFCDHFIRELPDAAAAAFCGTLPGATDPELYTRLAQAAARNNVPLLLDVWKDPGKLFSAARSVILKINKDELFQLTGAADIPSAFRTLEQQYGLTRAAITDGPGQAFAFDGSQLAVYTLPRLEKVVNPIGSGDTASAVLLGGIVSGTEFFPAFQSALAAASANCLSSLCGSFSMQDAADIARQITVEYHPL